MIMSRPVVKKRSPVCKILPINFTALPKIERVRFLSSFDTLVTDFDGVLWAGNKMICGAAEAINSMQDMGKTVYFVTNNSSKTKEEYIEKLRNNDFKFEEKNVVCTANLVARYLKDVMPPNKLVYVVGPQSIAEELDNQNIENDGSGPDPLTENLAIAINKMHFHENVGAVVVGFDCDISYIKILKAATYLADPECLFLACCMDDRVPTKDGLIIPGTGPIVSSIITCSKRKPFLIGKPGTFMLQYILEKRSVTPERTLIVGDRCNKDILFGKRCGFETLLVLSGVHNLDDVTEYENSKDPDERNSVPNYYTRSMYDLCPHCIRKS